MLNRAQRNLVHANAGLVNSVARGYLGRGIDADDLKQEGFMGLCEAADRASPECDQKQFRAYARWFVRGAMIDAICRASMIGRSRRERAARAVVNRAVEQLARDGILRPTVSEIAEASGMTARQVEEAFGLLTRKAVDVDRVVTGGSHDGDLPAAVDSALARLRLTRPREAMAVALAFGLGHESVRSRQEIASILGCPLPLVSVLKTRGLGFLRGELVSQGFGRVAVSRWFGDLVA